MAYAGDFSGAVDAKDRTAVDDLYNTLHSLEYVHTSVDDPSNITKMKLHPFQLASLMNLNPPNVLAARSLCPSLSSFSDDEIEDILTTLRRSTARGGMSAFTSGST